MKLFTKYNRINSWANIIIFGLGSLAFYFVLHYILIDQLDDSLKSEQQEIEEYVTLHKQLPEIQNTKHQWITVEKVVTPLPQKIKKSISFYNPKEDEQERVRQLLFPLTVSSQHYTITVNKSEVETEELLQLIIPIIVIMIGLILLGNYIINRKVVNRLLHPFYHTVDRIGNYHLSEQTPLQLPKEPIDEINLLNESLNKMTSRIYADYQVLKTFTENASHEMQTPLAVMRSKIEVLLQASEWKEKEMQQILAIDDASQKLSKLHQSLLLLTKLENHQFLLEEEVNLKIIIQQKVQEREEFLEPKNLNLKVDLEEVKLPFQHHLAEIMITNLLNNAMRYTPAGGIITIKLNPQTLIFTNTAIN